MKKRFSIMGLPVILGIVIIGCGHSAKDIDISESIQGSASQNQNAPLITNEYDVISGMIAEETESPTSELTVLSGDGILSMETESEQGDLFEENIEGYNFYGNTSGNIFNDGLLLKEQGKIVLFNVYEENTFISEMDGGNSTIIAAQPMIQLNLSDNKIYGVIQDEEVGKGRIVVYDIDTNVTETIRKGDVNNLQLVNDKLYYTDQEDDTLRKMELKDRTESVLWDQKVFYPVVYKDRIFFQNDADGESLYSITENGEDFQKLNDMRSYSPVVYKDAIYYSAYKDAAHTLRKMNLDGSNDTMLAQLNAVSLVVADGKLYFIDADVPDQICYMDLEQREPEIIKFSLESQIRKAILDTGGEGSFREFEVLQYDRLNFSGEYMLFFCLEKVDGEKFVDEFLYDKKTDEVTIIPKLFEEYDKKGETQNGIPVIIEMTPEDENGLLDEVPERSYPLGDYTVGSVYGPKLTQEELDQVADAVQLFLNTFDTSSMNDYQKVSTAHDYLCNICSYAPDWSKNRANTAWGALIYHEAQCSGYSRAMKALCDAMGVGCYYVHADANSINSSHQWNVCCVDGQWYIVDVQCNDSSGFRAFFLTSDNIYATSGMSWDRSSVPACPAAYAG